MDLALKHFSFFIFHFSFFMKTASTSNIHFTPWHLRDRTRNFRRDLEKTIQSNFFYSFLFLPKHKREAIIDIYRFCRAIDDIVDEMDDRNDAKHELDKWRIELERLYDGRPSMPISEKLETVLERYPMPKLYFEEMINGCEMDLHQNRYETFDDLYEYCYRVASITGLMCLEIFGYESSKTKEYAINLGIALQLTNILRDIAEDADRGRIYLPLEDLKRFGYSEEDLLNKTVNQNFRDLMQFECKRAHEYYAAAAEGLQQEDRPTLTAAVTMGRIYYGLLRRIERVNYDVYNNSIRLHRPQRFLIALSEWTKAVTR